MSTLTREEESRVRSLARLRCFRCRQSVTGGLLMTDPATGLLGWYVRENGSRVQLVADWSEDHMRACLGTQMEMRLTA